MINESQITIGMLIGGTAALGALLLVLRGLLHNAFWAGYDKCKEDMALRSTTWKDDEINKTV